MAQPTVATYNSGGWVTTPRTGPFGEYAAISLTGKAAGNIYYDSNYLAYRYNRADAYAKFTVSFGGTTFDFIPIVTYSEYPTGFVEIVQAGISAPGGFASPLAGSDSTIKSSYDNNWRYGNSEWQLGQTIHPIEVRWLCLLWQYDNGGSPNTWTSCYWMSAGGGYDYLNNSTGIPPLRRQDYLPSVVADWTVEVDFQRIISAKEQVWIKQSVNNSGEWVWASDEDPDTWIGKNTGEYRIVSSEAAGTFVSDGLLIDGVSHRRPGLSSYSFSSNKTIYARAGLTSTVGKYGPNLDGSGYNITAADHVSSTELSFCKGSVGLTDMDVRLGYDASDPPAPIQYTGDSDLGGGDTCSARGEDNEIEYLSTKGGNGYVKAEWTDLGISVEYGSDGSTRYMDGSAVDPEPEFIDQSGNVWVGCKSPLYVWSGTWTLNMYELDGTSHMDNHAPETDWDTNHWERDDPAPTEFWIRLTNPEDYSDCVSGDIKDSRVCFLYPREGAGASFAADGYQLDDLSATGALGVGGWAASGCTLAVVGGKLKVTDTTAGAYIYRADYLLGSPQDPYRPKHFPMYRFCNVVARTDEAGTSTPADFAGSLAIMRTVGEDSYTKEFTHFKRDVASNITTARFDLCKPTSASGADVTQSSIDQMQAEQTEDGKPYMELATSSWSWGPLGFDRIEIRLAEGLDYTFEELRCVPVTGDGYIGPGVEIVHEYNRNYYPGDIMLSAEAETYIRQTINRGGFITVNGRRCADIPAVRKQVIDGSGVTSYKNYSLYEALITQIEASVTSRNSWFLFPPDTFTSWDFTAGIVFDPDWWDETNQCYTNENTLFAIDKTPVAFAQPLHEVSELLEIDPYGSAVVPRDPTHAIYIRPYYDVISGDKTTGDNCLPWFGDGRDRTIRHDRLKLLFTKIVRSRVQGIAWQGSNAPDENDPIVQYQIPISCDASDIDPETVSSDDAGYFLSGQHRDLAVVAMAHTTNLSLYNRVLSRICDTLGGGLFGMSVDVEPACRTYLVYGAADGHSYLRITSNHGTTWSTPIDICEEIQPTITARWATGYQELVVVTTSSGTLYKRTSTDEGDTWSAPVSLWTGTHPHLFREPATDLKALYWYEDGKIYVRRSSDNLATFIETAQECVSDAADDAFVVFAAGDAANRIGLVYTDTTGVIQCKFSQANCLPPYV